MDRTARLLSRATRQSLILEVGAGYNPVAPKAEGWNTHVVDHADQTTLRAKYAPAAVDVNRIEPVDTIWQGGPLDAVIPAALLGRFDTMIASHVLEHMPDLIGFLTSAERVMRRGGTMAVALPDRRFCFDCLKPVTTTADLLEAHRAGRARHGIRTVWNHMAYAATIDDRLAWDAATTGQPRLVEDLTRIASLATTYDDDPSRPYEDFHCWFFTPAGFRLVMLELGQIGAVNWTVAEVTDTIGFEFFAFLQPGAVRPMDRDSLAQERTRLLREQLGEQRVVIDRFWAPQAPVAPPADDRLDRLLGMAVAWDERLDRIERVLRQRSLVSRAWGRFRRAVAGD